MKKDIKKVETKSVFSDTASPTPVKNIKVGDGGDSKLDFKVSRKGSAPKLRDETLLVQYELGQVEGKLSLRITANDKDGLFSNEPILVSKITECLAKQSKGISFASSILHPAFTKKSSNNAGFLAAILRAEKVLTAVKDKLFLHDLAIDAKTLEKHLSK
jgi:hypothetical protein